MLAALVTLAYRDKVVYVWLCETGPLCIGILLCTVVQSFISKKEIIQMYSLHAMTYFMTAISILDSKDEIKAHPCNSLNVDIVN